MASPDYDFSCVFGTITVNPVIKLIVINNIFTPNGDWITDAWVIKDLGSYPNNKVEAYKRYREKVYSSVGYGIPGMERIKGDTTNRPCYYIINSKNDSKVLSGRVAIIR